MYNIILMHTYVCVYIYNINIHIHMSIVNFTSTLHAILNNKQPVIAEFFVV